MLIGQNLFWFMLTFWGGSFEMHFFEGAIVAIFWIVCFLVFIHAVWLLLKCLFLVTGQFSIRLQFWLNLVSDILCVKTKKTKIHSIFIFSILYLHCWYTNIILYFYKFIFYVVNKTTKCNRGDIILQSNTWW